MAGKMTFEKANEKLEKLVAGFTLWSYNNTYHVKSNGQKMSVFLKITKVQGNYLTPLYDSIYCLAYIYYGTFVFF